MNINAASTEPGGGGPNPSSDSPPVFRASMVRQGSETLVLGPGTEAELLKLPPRRLVQIIRDLLSCVRPSPPHASAAPPGRQDPRVSESISNSTSNLVDVENIESMELTSSAHIAAAAAPGQGGGLSIAYMDSAASVTARRENWPYTRIKLLGNGTCGKVSLEWDNEENRPVAVKEVPRADLTKKRIGGPSKEQQRYKSFLEEVRIMGGLHHKNIVSMYKIIDDPNLDAVYLVMQYVDRGAIGSVEVRNGVDECCKPIPADLLAGYVRQMLDALMHMHSKGVIHRDIKPENILIDHEGHVFLADFGVSETFEPDHKGKVEKMMMQSMAQSMAMSVAGGRAGGPKVLGTKGTMLFIAPELWRNEKAYGKAVDMWAIGVTIYTLLTGRLPFRNLDEISDPSLPHIPTEFGPGWSQLLHGMLNRDPKRRLTAKQALGEAISLCPPSVVTTTLTVPSSASNRILPNINMASLPDSRDAVNPTEVSPAAPRDRGSILSPVPPREKKDTAVRSFHGARGVE